jgi:hypothetical protein
MSYARGQFWFAPTEAGTQVKWAYSFRAKNGVTKLPLMYSRTLNGKDTWMCA